MAFLGPSSIFEAESIRVKEALSWVISRGVKRVMVELDSMLTVAANSWSKGECVGGWSCDWTMQTLVKVVTGS